MCTMISVWYLWEPGEGYRCLESRCTAVYEPPYTRKQSWSSARAAGALNCWVNSVVHSCSYVFGCVLILQQLSHLSCPTTLNFHCDLKKKGNPMAVPESLAYWIFQTHSPVTLFLRTFLVNALERRPLYSEFLQHLQRLCPYREVSPTFQRKLPEGRVCVYSIWLLLLTVPYAELILNPSMIL